MKRIKPRAIISFLSFFSFVSTTIIIILLAKGYSINLKNKTVDKAGMIVITSEPKGALLYIDDKLQQDVSNTTVSNIPPSNYQVRLEKEGFTSWAKEIVVEENIVTEINAILFPLNPSLTPITSYGAYQPKLNSEYNKIAFQIRDTEEKKGLWILTFTNLPFGKGYDIERILADTPINKYSESDFTWSPDSKEIFISLKNGNEFNNFLISTESNSQELTVTEKSREEILLIWQREKDSLLDDKISTLTQEEQNIIKLNKEEISWSEDQKKFFYLNDEGYLVFYDLEKKETITSTIKKDVYQNTIWYPDNERMVLLEKDTTENVGKIYISEIDGLNKMSVYEGVIFSSDIFISPNGEKLFFLTNFNISTGIHPNLYSVSLK